MELIGRQGRKKSDSGNTVSMKNIYALKGNGSRGQKGGENSKAGILSRKIIGFVKRDIPMVNSCWPLMTFLSFLCLEMVSRMNYSITLPGLTWCCCSLGPSCPQWRQEWHWLCSGSSRHHSHSKIAKSSLMMTSTRSLCTYGYIPSRPMDLYLSSFLKCSLTRLSSTKGKFSFLQIVPWSLGPEMDEVQSW